jgi:hypothetical protein
VGEQYGSPRTFKMVRAIPGQVTDHYCGTIADFAGEGLAGSGVTYRPNGIPTCCPGPAAPAGGVQIGGTATVAQDQPRCLFGPSSGGGSLQFYYSFATPNLVTSYAPLPASAQAQGIEFGVVTGTQAVLTGTVQVGTAPGLDDLGSYTGVMTNQNWLGQPPFLQGTFLAPITFTSPVGTVYVTWSDGSLSNGETPQVINGGSIVYGYYNSDPIVFAPNYCVWGLPWPDYLVVSTGAVQLGGAASYTVPFVEISTGAVQLGGAAEVVSIDEITSTGGVEIGGTAGYTIGYVRSGSGGVEIGGAATVSEGLIRVSTGAVELGGTATVNVPIVVTSTGAVELGGVASIAGFFVWATPGAHTTTLPAGVTKITITNCIGGGAQGGRYSGTSSGGGGGGGGCRYGTGLTASGGQVVIGNVGQEGIYGVQNATASTFELAGTVIMTGGPGVSGGPGEGGAGGTSSGSGSGFNGGAGAFGDDRDDGGGGGGAAGNLGAGGNASGTTGGAAGANSVAGITGAGGTGATGVSVAPEQGNPYGAGGGGEAVHGTHTAAPGWSGYIRWRYKPFPP